MSRVAMPRRRLGSSELEVSALALGSWQTFEQIPREAGIAVMTAAREAGIDFLDDARYDDKIGTAPIPSGYSEVVFGELFRAAGWKRDEVVVSNKLWWEFWPEQTAEQELDASLGRMGFDHLDLVYSEQPPEGLPIEDVVEAVNGLLTAGKARAWGVLNWAPEQIAEATRAAAVAGAPFPCAAQLPYGLAYSHVVEDVVMGEVLRTAGASVVASFVLAGGALTGKYSSNASAGRLAQQQAAERDSDFWRGAHRIGGRLREIADELGTTPARLALAYALANPLVATALFGATDPEQVAENVGAIELLGHMSEADLARLRGTREDAQP